MSPEFNRRAFLNRVGKTSAALGVTSMVGVQNVAANDDHDVSTMLERPEVQDVLNEIDSLYRGGRLSTQEAVGLLYGADSGVGTDTLTQDFISKDVQFSDASHRLGIDRLTADRGVLGHVGYGDFGVSIAKVNPQALGASVSLDSGANGSDAGLTVVGHGDGSYALRPLNNAEDQLVSDEIDADEFQAFTHTGTSGVLAVSEAAASDDQRVKVYQLSTDASEPVMERVNNVRLDTEETIWKGGVEPADVTKQDQDCAGEIGYCATSAYLCVQESALCYLCTASACSISTIAWPALSVCVGCILVVCGTAALPQLGSCGTTLDCLLEYGSGWAPIDQIELPDWYADGDYPCRN